MRNFGSVTKDSRPANYQNYIFVITFLLLSTINKNMQKGYDLTQPS